MSPKRSKAARPDSREALLEAAALEFAAHGFDGVRMEHVAQRAGYNKSLVYRHFGDKQTLFDEMLCHCFRKRQARVEERPPGLADQLEFWVAAQTADRSMLQLIMQEALQDRGGEPVSAEARRAYYASLMEDLRRMQEAGEVDPAFDVPMLFLALLGVTVVPVMLPQIARLVTGDAPGSPEFDSRWKRLLRQLADHLPAPE